MELRFDLREQRHYTRKRQRPLFFNIFMSDLQTDPDSDSLLFKYADDSTLIIPVWKGDSDSNTAAHVVNNFTEWSER